MQMSHYLMKYACANLHKFLVQKSKHWIFLHIRVKSFSRGNFGYLIFVTTIQKMLRTDRKHYFPNFWGIKMLYIIKQIIYEQIPL